MSTGRERGHDTPAALAVPAAQDTAVTDTAVADELTEVAEVAGVAGSELPWAGVRDWAAAFLLAQRSRHTRRAYAADLTDFFTWCTTQPVSPWRCARVHLDAYTRQLETLPRPRTGRPASANTVARRLAALAGVYGYAVDHLGLAVSPLARIPRPRVDDEAVAVGLGRTDLQALLAAAAAHSPRAHALVALLAHTGLRIHEALAADVTDWNIERDHHVLQLVRKGAIPGVTVLSAPVRRALETYLVGRSSGPLFMTGSGGRMDQPAAWRLLRRLATDARLAGADRVNPHALRHSFVTVALDAGVPLRDVQDAAGHQDLNTTRRYDRARHLLDRHATYAVTASLAAAPA